MVVSKGFALVLKGFFTHSLENSTILSNNFKGCGFEVGFYIEKKLEKMILDFITSSKAKMVVLLDRLWTPKASHQQARGY